MTAWRLPGTALVLLGLAACSSAHSAAHTDPLPPTQATVAHAAPTSSPAPPAPAGLPDACTLLTRDEASALAGVKLDPVEAGDDVKAADPTSDIASCVYYAPVTGPNGEVGVFAEMGTPHAMAVDQAIGHKFHAVPGICDQTMEEQDNIFVRCGQVWVTLNSAYGAPPARLEAAARAVATRLQGT